MYSRKHWLKNIKKKKNPAHPPSVSVTITTQAHIQENNLQLNYTFKKIWETWPIPPTRLVVKDHVGAEILELDIIGSSNSCWRFGTHRPNVRPCFINSHFQSSSNNSINYKASIKNDALLIFIPKSKTNTTRKTTVHSKNTPTRWGSHIPFFAFPSVLIFTYVLIEQSFVQYLFEEK